MASEITAPGGKTSGRLCTGPQCFNKEMTLITAFHSLLTKPTTWALAKCKGFEKHESYEWRWGEQYNSHHKSEKGMMRYPVAISGPALDSFLVEKG